MVSTRRSGSPVIEPSEPAVKKRPRPAPRPPKYPAWLSAAVVADLENDVINIGPKALPIAEKSSHVERRVGGKVVFLRRGKWEEEKRKVSFSLSFSFGCQRR
jgi:hypothetical protein